MIRYIRELRDARIVIEADTSDEIVSLLEKLDVEMMRDDGWITWKGGERPVDGDTLVVVKLRDGRTLKDWRAKDCLWPHNGGAGDIVAYRIVGDA